MATLHVPAFGGGVVLAGSSDAQAANELRQADGVDIGPRGQLTTCGGISSYGEVLKDVQTTPQPVSAVYGMGPASFAVDTQCYAVSGGLSSGLTPRYFVHSFPPGFTSNGVATTLGVVGTTRQPRGAIVTSAAFPYVDASGVALRPLFLNVGARSPDVPRSAPGLYVVGPGLNPILNYDALGTGLLGQFPGGTHAVQLYFRGIAGYNNHLFGWGFDNSDVTNGDGPSRLMFSNLGNPFMWGNDNLAAPGMDRAFSDSDAITVGTAGEVIIACQASRGRLYIGTNRGLHYLAGYGRDSFQTDGTTGVAESLDVIGPNAMIEGPDGLLYGSSSRGLWRFGTTGAVEHLYRKLVNFNGESPGYWDLIYTTPGASAGYPGGSNADLVWMYSDVSTMQVCIVIPFANLDGSGNGTAIIKYHTETGGFTRQLISPNNVSFTAGAVFKRTPISAAVTVFGDSGSGNGLTVRQYPPLNPSDTSTSGMVTFGEYASFGPDGSGVSRICYLVLSWVSTSLPMTGTITPSIDQSVLPSVNLSIQLTAPISPSDGDLWVDTSGTDTNLGNATAGTLVRATHDYLVKTWNAGWNKWTIQPRAGGANGTRIGIPIPFLPQRGARVKFAVSLAGQDTIQIEGLGMDPASVRDAA